MTTEKEYLEDKIRELDKLINAANVRIAYTKGEIAQLEKSIFELVSRSSELLASKSSELNPPQKCQTKNIY